MKVVWKTVIVFMLAISFAGCSSSGSQIVKEEPSTHPHFYPNAKAAGNFHIINFMDRRTGKIGVQVLDRYEEPYFLGKERIRAEITLENGKTETVWLNGEGYEVEQSEGGEYAIGATLYSKRFKWVKDSHSALLKVWVPLPDGKIYELTFECKVREPLPEHSGIRTK